MYVICMCTFVACIFVIASGLCVDLHVVGCVWLCVCCDCGCASCIYACKCTGLHVSMPFCGFYWMVIFGVVRLCLKPFLLGWCAKGFVLLS